MAVVLLASVVIVFLVLWLWTTLDMIFTPDEKDWAINVMFGVFEDKHRKE